MRPTFEQSEETRRLIALFLEMKLNERVTYQQASKKVGFQVGPGKSMTARKTAEKDHGIFIYCEPKVGFVRGDGSEMTKSCVSMTESIRRKGRKVAGRAELALTTNLDRDEHLLASELLSRSRIIISTASSVRITTNRKAKNSGERAEPFNTAGALAGLK